MTEIEVYDYEARKLEEASDRLGVTIAQVVEWLVEESLDEIVEEMECE